MVQTKDKRPYSTDTQFERRKSAPSRPYAWMDFKIADKSYLDLSLPMIVGPEGYSNVLDIHFILKSLRTSVNYESVIQDALLEIKHIMPYPLVWNADRVWSYEIKMDNPRVFLLREHVTMMTDLLKDFSSGPAITAAQYFIPTEYKVKGVLQDSQFYLNVNPQNVIAVHNDFDENCTLPRCQMYQS